MDQPVAAAMPETIDEAMDAVTRDHSHRVIQREGKDSVVVMSLRAFLDLKFGPAPEWLEQCWAEAKEAGLDQMTMEEIDAEIAAYRREKAQTDRNP